MSSVVFPSQSVLKCTLFKLEGVHYADGIASLSVGTHTLGDVDSEEEKGRKSERKRGLHAHSGKSVCLCV